MVKFKVDAMDRATLKIIDDHILYRIQVIDINDNSPKFKQDVYNVDILESTYPGTSVFRIKAEDPDEISSGNGQVSYSIISQDPKTPLSMFRIDENNGTIFLQKCLDYEAIKSYSLIITARDNGRNVLSSSAQVKFKVIDSNTHPPIFIQKSASAIINESAKNMVILQVGVTDQDTPNTPAWRAKFKIIEGNENENYKMETDPETNEGLLSLIKSLDYELGPKRNLKITVENEEPLFTCLDTKPMEPEVLSAVITVKDVNDHPVFDPPVLVVNEHEGEKPGRVLGKFNAYDTDKFYKHSIKYYKGDEPAGWVTVDSETGVVTTVKELDRESPYVNNSVYVFTVHAIEFGENPMTGTGTMSIILSDINDNQPYLETEYEDMCDDGEMKFITVTANDKDLEPFSSPFTFELLDNEQNIKKNWELGKTTELTALIFHASLEKKPASILSSQVVSNEVGLGVKRNTINYGSQRNVGGMQSNVNGTIRQMNPYDSRALSFRSNLNTYGDGRLRMNNMSQRYSMYGLANRQSMDHSSHASSVFNSKDSLYFNRAQDWGARERMDMDAEIIEAVYKPCVYDDEGEESSRLTLDSISRIEDNISLSFLNDLGPKFKTLAKVCQDKNPHLSQQE
ncbi:cadherin-like protein 26 [Mobula birostris]|uniref:cadherin-like protein 26 n=1 Tax=Mobula birostris TaxID=1983395 RepID=UPI003B283437